MDELRNEPLQQRRKMTEIGSEAFELYEKSVAFGGSRVTGFVHVDGRLVRIAVDARTIEEAEAVLDRTARAREENG